MINKTTKCMLSTALLVGGFASATASADVVGYWRLEDGTSGNDIVSTADSSGNDLSAVQWTSNEEAAQYSSNVGGAYVYDPVADTYTANTLSMHAPASVLSDDTQILAAGAATAITGDTWTFEMFFQVLDEGAAATLDSSNSSRLLNVDGGNSATLEWRHNYENARVRDAGIGLDANMQSFSGASDAEDGLWHHVAVTVDYNATTDETTVELFYDYVSLGTATDASTGGAFNPNGDLRFGLSSTSDGDYDWFFDEARLSNGVLSSSEFLQLSSVPEPGALSLLAIGGFLIAARRRLA